MPNQRAKREKIMKTIANITTATTAELVAFFNANCEVINANPVKRFADRKTAEKRVAALMASIPAEPVACEKRTAAEGIAASWKNPEVATKRMTRHQVEVNGEEFRSVGQAFAQLGLGNSNAAIKFRMQLKSAGAATFTAANGEKYNFSLADQY